MTFPALDELLGQSFDDSEIHDTIARIAEEIGDDSFRRWHTSREFAQNIRDGQSYFNSPGSQSPPLRHSASQLLKCQRKSYYSDRNAPKESAEPSGIFWAGSNIETDLIVPYLQAVSADDMYVQNSMWVDFEIKSDAGQLHFKGETDPVFVDGDAAPLLLTEIKTRDSVDRLSNPSEPHRAQAHCYMYGLSQSEDRNIRDSLIIYLDRSTLDLKSFHVEFDPVFWRQRVLEWCAQQSKARINDQLPPADPERYWECEYCSYQNRCGKETDDEIADSPPIGLAPLHEYPREMVTKYIAAHPKLDQKLTPTVGHQFPGLAEKHGVYNWSCTSCGENFRYDRITPTDGEDAPSCPACDGDSESEQTVRGPTPEEQESLLQGPLPAEQPGGK